MSQSQAIPSAWSRGLDAERWFYLVAGFALLICVAIGFQQFYLRARDSGGAELNPRIAPLVLAHGVVMSAWILLFVAQSALIVGANVRAHMKLGVAGAVLAVMLVVIGISTALASVHYNADAYKNLWGARAFLTIPLTVVLSFGILVGIALKNRHRPEIHRPMMLLATLFTVSAALFRMQITTTLMTATHGSMFYVAYGPMLVLGALFLLMKLLVTRKFDRYLALGYLGVAFACLLCATVAPTKLWSEIAGIVAR